MLHLLYRSVKTHWPEAYTSISTDFDQQVRTNPFRSLILFRGGPAFLISLFISVVIDRNDGYPWVGSALLIAIYLTFTTFKAIGEIMRKSRPPHWAVLVLYHCGAAIITSLAIVVATALRNRLESFIPPTKDLLIALWAGIFAAVFATAARSILSPIKLNIAETVEQLRDDIGDENWNDISEATKNHSEMSDLLRAIILAEVQQRPRWFRKLERMKGIVRQPGTYGVAQVASDRPISDRESIKSLAQRFSTYSIPEAYEGYPDYHQLRNDLLEHNPDGPHADRIIDFYKFLSEN